jgi:cytochrome oxidase assembly protein ShyY1
VRRIFLTPKWLLGHALVVLVAVSFTGFGVWQLQRHEARLERNEVALARMAAEAVDLETALRLAAAESSDAGVHPLAYRRVRVSGVYDPSSEVLRRPVSRDGRPGYHVITPLVRDGGRAVLIERGWVPQELGQVPVREAPPPPGEVTVEGWAFPTERPPTGPLAGLAARDPAEGPLTAVAYVDDERLAQQMPYGLEGAVVLLDAPHRPPGDTTLPLPPPRPSVGAGAHLGYAVQWFSFALIAVIGYVALVRRVAREDAAAAERAGGGASPDGAVSRSGR